MILDEAKAMLNVSPELVEGWMLNEDPNLKKATKACVHERNLLSSAFLIQNPTPIIQNFFQ